MMQWIDAGNGRQVYRKVESDAPRARSDLPAPMIKRDDMAPVKSMADGKMYDSKSAIRKSYLPEGNPQGIHYTEVGDDSHRLSTRKTAEAKRPPVEESIDKAIARFKNGEVGAE